MNEFNGNTWLAEVQDIGNEIAALTVAKAAELSAFLRLVHKIEPAGNDVIVPPLPPPPPPPQATERTVHLDGFDATRKVHVIKVVREITGLGLKEAKELVDGAPKVIKENLPAAEAEALQKKLEEAGARVSLKV